MNPRTLLLTLTLMGLLAGVSGAAGRNRNQGPGPAAPTSATQLTAAEKENILHMREEEKLARDVYLVFAEMWQCPVFTNIAEAEKRHMAAAGLLIAKYGLTDPVTDDTIGVFSTPEFTKLYTSLTETGAKSLLDALKVGVQIEERDIADLKTALSKTSKPDLEWVFDNLKKGSTNHLRAFTRNIEAGGTDCQLQDRNGPGGEPPQGAKDTAGQGRARGRGKNRGNADQNRTGSREQQQNRDGSCRPAGPAQP